MFIRNTDQDVDVVVLYTVCWEMWRQGNSERFSMTCLSGFRWRKS